MAPFLITYTFRLDDASVPAWHRHVEEFIAALDADPELKGRIRYRCMKERDSATYHHLAEPLDEGAADILQRRDFFKRYTAETKRVGGGTVAVVALETIAETR